MSGGGASPEAEITVLSALAPLFAGVKDSANFRGFFQQEGCLASLPRAGRL